MGEPRDEVERRPEIRFRRAPLPADTGGAVYGRRGSDAAIIVDPRLHGPDEEAAIAHELVHHIRGGPCLDDPSLPPSWQAVVAREEDRVASQVALWLVPRDELIQFIEEQISGGQVGVTIAEVAERFRRPHYVAERALRDLARENPAGWEAVA